MLFFAALLLTATQDAGPYDADPRFPANRLHRAMFTWTPGGTRMPACTEADPLFWPLSIELWKFADDLLPAIDAVVAAPPADPLRRALLQHDVWMFFDALDGFPLANSRSWPPETAERRLDVRRRLAPLLRRLALAPDEVAALPDPYRRAADAKTWPADFDPAKPTQPFLPPDLDAKEGPWVLVGPKDGGVAAPGHAQHFLGHSAFLVYLSTPLGREVTLEYVRRVQAQPAAPPPPDGSRLLLRRRAFLLDARGEPVLSPITQEIQIRVARPPALRPPGDGLFDFRLRRADLVAGKPALHAADVEERGLVFLFHRGPARDPVRSSCVECHGTSSRLSSGSRPDGRDARGHALFKRIRMEETTPEQEAKAAIEARSRDRVAVTLKELWPKD